MNIRDELSPNIFTLEVTDDQPDRFFAIIDGRVATDCSPVTVTHQGIALVLGDLTVVDAPPLPTSRDQCKNGGWQTYGVFKNQGDCVSFVATGGKKPPR
jgi:hypothetical protein